MWNTPKFLQDATAASHPREAPVAAQQADLTLQVAAKALSCPFHQDHPIASGTFNMLYRTIVGALGVHENAVKKGRAMCGTSAGSSYRLLRRKHVFTPALAALAAMTVSSASRSFSSKSQHRSDQVLPSALKSDTTSSTPYFRHRVRHAAKR